MPIYVRRPGDQVTGNNRYFYADGMQIILHHLVKLPVHVYAEFHKIRIPRRAAFSVPRPVRVVLRLVEAPLYSPDRSLNRIFFLSQRAYPFMSPCLFQTVTGIIFHQKIFIKPFLDLIPVRLHLFSRISFHGPLDRRIFIVDLDCDHCRVVNQCQSGIRIHMTQKLLRIFFLKLDQTLVIHGMPLDTGRRSARIVQFIRFHKFS